MKININNIFKLLSQNNRSSEPFGESAGEARESLTVKIGSGFLAAADTGNKAPSHKTFIANNTSAVRDSGQKFNAINVKAQVKLLKEALNFPQDIEELFSRLMYKKTTEETIKNVLQQANQTINTELIREMLETNSKQSVDKLIKLFQQAPGGTQNTEQLKEIMSLISQITPKKDSSPQEVVTNLVLLYLPWFPLAEKQDVEIRFEKHKNSEGEDFEQTALVVYITTINLGRFRVEILLKGTSIKINVENYEDEGQKTLNKEEYLKKILDEINIRIEKNNIPATTELIISAQKEYREENQERKREVVICPAGEISSAAVIVAQKIAGIILEIDERASLIETRAGQLNSSCEIEKKF